MSSEKDPDIANTVRHDDPAALESFAKNFRQLVTNMHEMAISMGKEADFPLDPEEFTEEKLIEMLLKPQDFYGDISDQKPDFENIFKNIKIDENDPRLKALRKAFKKPLQ
jgi:hypothetical protein